MSGAVTTACPVPLKLAYDTGMSIPLYFVALFHLSEQHPSQWRGVSVNGWVTCFSKVKIHGAWDNYKIHMQILWIQLHMQ